MNTVIAQHHLRYQFERLGMLGLIGIVLIIFSLYWWENNIRTTQYDNEILVKKINRPDFFSKTQNQIDNDIKYNKEKQLKIFYNHFPNKKQIPNILENLYASAKIHGLELESGEYTSSLVTTTGFSEYRITFPVSGRFTQILAFVDAALSKNKSLSLDVASFKRTKVGDQLIEAKLVFTIFLKDSV